MARHGSTDRLVRLLALPAWVAEHDGATFGEAAAHFGVDADTVRADVETLWVSGLPGGMPGDLVDFDATAFEEGRLSLTHPLGLDTPVRLSRQEAISLLLSLRVLADVLRDDPADTTALEGARRALESAVRNRPAESSASGDAASPDPRAASAATAVPTPAATAAATVTGTVRRALAEGRRLRLTYVSATDTRSVREVDPLELVTDGTHLTLHAWCRTAGARRSFRLDRILAAERLDAPVAPGRARRRDRSMTAQPETAVLTVAPSGRWLVERMHCDDVVVHEDASLTATVHGRDRAWLVGLVLSAGRHLIAVQPEDLRAEAGRQARSALALYGLGTGDDTTAAGQEPPAPGNRR